MEGCIVEGPACPSIHSPLLESQNIEQWAEIGRESQDIEQASHSQVQESFLEVLRETRACSMPEESKKTHEKQSLLTRQ